MAVTLIQLQNGNKSYGARKIFEDASFAVNEGEHIGVIGPNGAGKTTLFKILAEQEDLDSGQVTRSQQLRLGYLEQEADWNLNEVVEDYLKNNCLKPIWELKRLGLGLGLEETHFAAKLATLSGGYRMRVKLLYLIGQEPNLLLLDEPTNFLDLETLLVFESFLQDFSGSFMMISHDREFLRRTTDHIIEVESGDITKFAGNLDDYFEQKELLQEVLQKQILNQETKKKSIMDFVTRFGAKATKAKQAQSRLRALEKMEKIELKSLPVRATIHIPKPAQTGKEILNLDNAQCGYPDKIILKNVHLRLERGKHLGIVGINGAGKSTLLKTLGSQISLLGGELSYGLNVSLAYFSQHSSDQLNPEASVLECLTQAAHTTVVQQDILNIAGSLLFSGENIKKKVKVLSGGEKSRVALGQILLKKAPLLLLDEPTNHLDFETVEALTEALSRYEGSIVTVSHDRAFISRVANQILEIRDRGLHLYPGTYDEYVWSLQRGYLSQLKTNTPSAMANDEKASLPRSRGEADNSKFNYKEERKRLENLLKKQKKEIQTLEERLHSLAKIQLELTEKIVTLVGLEAQKASKDLHQISNEMIQLEDTLLTIMEESEQTQTSIQNLIQQT